MGITVLGPVSVDGNGALGPRDRVVLAVLALRPGEAVGTERLAEALWGDTPPPSWNKVVPGCVMRLRRALGSEAIATTTHGYRLTVPAEEVDAHRFERLVGRGRELLAGGEAERAAHALGEALALWQGRPLVELEDWAPGRAEAARLEGLRLDAEEQRWAAELAAGRHDAVLSELSAGVVEAPLRERRWAQLALAEYRCGRQGDALRTIQRARTTLVNALGVDAGPELVALERAILVHDPALQCVDAGPQPSAVCPYLGLVPYDVGDAEVFFGRDREIAECVRRITAANLLTVAGPSGSGKSSLVRAGVAAALQRDGRVVRVITPGSHPMSSLAEVEPDCVLVVDQCEEATVLCPDDFERAAFFDAIAAHAARQPVIVAMRADRLGDLTEHPGFARLVEISLYLLGALGDDELRAAIEGPARTAGLVLEPGLVHVLVHDVEGEPGALPLLSHALRQTWERREGRTLTVDGYRQTGGIRGAVAHSAEALYEALPEAQRGLLRTLLLRLVAITPDGEAVRTRMPRRLVAIDADHEQLVEQLVNARLATADETTVELAHESLARAWPRLRGWLDDDVSGQRILRHLVGAADAWDALGRPASELYRGGRLAQALEWRDQAGPDLGPVEHAFLDAGKQEEDGERHAAVRRARARRRTRALFAAVAVLAVAGVLAATVAVRQAADQAGDDRSRAGGEARRAAALALEGDDPGLATLLAIEAVRLDDNVDTRANLHTVLQRDGRLMWSLSTRVEPQHLAASPAGNVVVGGADRDGQPVFSFFGRIGPDRVNRGTTFGQGTHVEFRPDGAQVAVTGHQGLLPESLQLVDTATLEPAAVQPGGLPASTDVFAAYSGDSRFLAASFPRGVGDRNTVLVWSLATPDAPILQLDERGQFVPGVALSPDGSRLYVWEHKDGGGQLRAYDVATGAVVAEADPLPPTESGCCLPGGVEISPEGATIAVLRGEDVVLYRSRDLRERARLRSDDDSRTWWDDVRFSHGGELLAVGGPDGVSVWDVATRRQWLRVPGASAAFGPNDATLYTILDRGIAQWDLARDRRPVRAVNEADSDPFFTDRTEHAASAPAAALALDAATPDGSAVVYVSPLAQDPVRFLDTDGGEPVEGPDVLGRAVSWRPPQFDTVAIAGDDATVRLVDRRSGEILAERPMTSAITALSFTADSDRLLVGQSDGQLVALAGGSLEPTATLVDVGESVLGVHPIDGTRAAVLIGRQSEISRTGQRYALVDLNDGTIVEEGSVGFDHAAGAASPDGARLAVVGLGGEVGIRRLDNSGWVRPPIDAALNNEVSSISYAPDGHTFVIADAGGEVQLWDDATGAPIARLRPGRADVSASARFHTDGHTVVIATADGAVFHWDTRVESTIAAACAFAGRNMTPTEWREAFPGRPYRETCPTS